jgi:DNA-binding MarR family transcriptional regulator
VNERAHAFEEIGAELRVMGRRFKSVIAERATDVHPQLQPASFYILGFLIENGPTRGSALACQFDIDKGAISRQVQHLVELGLAERAADPEDGRAHLISATAEAVRLAEEADAAQQRKWKLRLGEWSDEELKSFAAQLDRFNNDLA